jgi:hypothetical protein
MYTNLNYDLVMSFALFKEIYPHSDIRRQSFVFGRSPVQISALEWLSGRLLLIFAALPPKQKLE